MRRHDPGDIRRHAAMRGTRGLPGLFGKQERLLIPLEDDGNAKDSIVLRNVFGFGVSDVHRLHDRRVTDEPPNGTHHSGESSFGELMEVVWIRSRVDQPALPSAAHYL